MNATATTPDVRVVVDLHARVGEGPVVADDGRTVHWVDIPEGQVHTTDLADGSTRTHRLDTMVGAVARRRRGGFVAAVTEGFASIDDLGRWEVRQAILPAGVRMNDAACDAAGRFWAGSTALDFAPGRGALHVLRPDWSTDVVLDGLTQPNGLGWSPDGRAFHLVDSALGTLTRWACDPASGRLSHPEVLLEIPAADGAPDGLTVDTAGDLWLAVWGGSHLLHLSPDGAVRRRIDVPVRQPSSCAFAGRDGGTLVVTSAAEGLPPAGDPRDLSPDGALLALTGLGAWGRPDHEFHG